MNKIPHVSVIQSSVSKMILLMFLGSCRGVQCSSVHQWPFLTALVTVKVQLLFFRTLVTTVTTMISKVNMLLPYSEDIPSQEAESWK